MREFWRRTVEFVTRMWAHLNAGQRVALALLLGLLAVFVGWGVRAATPAGMRVLVSADESQDVRFQARKALEERRIPHQLSDGAILVPREQYDAAFLELYGAGVFDDTRLYEFLDRMNLTATRWERERLWQVAKQRKIAQLIMKLKKFRDVQVAYEIPTDPHRFGQIPQEPTAVVVAQLLPGEEATKSDVRAIAAILRGAIEGLKPENTHITTVGRDGPMPWRLPRTEDGTATAYEWNEVERELAREIEAAVLKLFAMHYPGTHVVVQPTVNRSLVQSEKREYSNPRAVEERSETREASSRTQGIQPGMGGAVGQGPANLRAGVLSGPNIDTRESENVTETRSVVTQETTHTTAPPGEVIGMSVAVMIPADPPDDRRIRDLSEAVKAAALRGRVNNPEIKLLFLGPPPPPQVAAVSFWALMRTWWLENWLRVFLAALLVAVLVLIYRAVRRAMEIRAAVGVEEIEKAVAAEAPEFAAAVEAEELVARMRTFIKDLVQKNPRAVAVVLRRWMSGRRQ